MTAGPSRSPWQEVLAPFATPSTRRGSIAVLTSVVPYLALSVAMYLAISVSPLLTLALAIPTTGFLVRVFVVFHDCVHGSLLPSRRANAWVGNVLGVIVLTPFRSWQHDHAVHHATSGDLDRRGVGDVITLTVAEYRGRSPRARLLYRLIRNPLIMFTLGPIIAMIIGPRIPAKNARPRFRRSVLQTDAALAVAIGAACWLLGWSNFLLVWGPSALLAGSVGVWLFYVQHQFEDAYWQSGDEWNYADAALRGASHLKLPAVLRFFTGNIGLHHVHHLNARIPGYNLPRAHAASPAFDNVPTLSIWDGLRSVHYKLWDEHAARLVTFTQARHSLVHPNVAPQGA
jgi:acyl-lipid omega-6 desaturase (Delta-12 desaturase)